MQIHTPSQLKQIEQDLPYLVETMEWVKGFVAKHHPIVGRLGPVCPFVPHAIKSNCMHLGVLRITGLDVEQIANILLHYQDVFQKLEPQAGPETLRKTLLLIVPDIDIEDASTIIDGAQKKVKPLFVESGMMIGEFHNRTESPGLHNPDFRPLRSPIPMFVLRNMVEVDIAFLQDENLHLRIKYLEAYLKHMEGTYSHRFEQKIKDETRLTTARELVELARVQLQLEAALV
jgi:hypothetical protein